MVAKQWNQGLKLRCNKIILHKPMVKIKLSHTMHIITWQWPINCVHDPVPTDNRISHLLDIRQRDDKHLPRWLSRHNHKYCQLFPRRTQPSYQFGGHIYWLDFKDSLIKFSLVKSQIPHSLANHKHQIKINMAHKEKEDNHTCDIPNLMGWA